MQLAKAKNRYLFYLVALLAFVAGFAVMVGCQDQGAQEPAGSGETASVDLSGDASAIAEARGLTPDDVLAALKTYTPSGVHDEYVMFASGGHSGQVSSSGSRPCGS